MRRQMGDNVMRLSAFSPGRRRASSWHSALGSALPPPAAPAPKPVQQISDTATRLAAARMEITAPRAQPRGFAFERF